MTTVSPATYYAVAKRLLEDSITLESDLKNLDTQLDVIRSSGLWTVGRLWGQSFDQGASDTFEAGSLSAMAARALGTQIHTAGQNLARAENESHPGTPDPIPNVPAGTGLITSLHPTQLSIGSKEGNPDHWGLVDEYITNEWPDCDEGRIETAGTNLSAYGVKVVDAASKLYLDITALIPDAERDKDAILNGYVSDTVKVCRAIEGSSEAAKALAIACTQVGAFAKLGKQDCRTSLNLLKALIAAYDVEKAAAKRIPKGGKAMGEIIDNLITLNKKKYAEVIAGRIVEVENKFGDAMRSNSAIYDLVNDRTDELAGILKRIPRNWQYVSRGIGENSAAGAQGEYRAGVPSNYSKRKVTIVDSNGVDQSSVPDYIDDVNRQVMEVKNTNDIARYSDQILIQEQWARENGYTLTLVVDHRTQIDDPEIASKIRTGQIQLLRKELDDNNDP